MSVALPDTMRVYIDERVKSGSYGNTSEYLRDLVRRDQEAQARQRLRELIEDGLRSGPGRALGLEDWAALRQTALAAQPLCSRLSCDHGLSRI